MTRKRSPYRPRAVMTNPLAAMCPEEEWRPVVGYEGLYSVSSHGQVRSERRQVPGKLGSVRTLPQKLRSLTPDSSGYLQVGLRDGKRSRMFKVAYLVARAFIGARPDGLQVCHNDGNMRNNVWTNLRYDTRAGNMADKLAHGTHSRGERSASAKLTEEQVAVIRRDGRSCRAIARALSVHHSTISAIKRGVTWS